MLNHSRKLLIVTPEFPPKQWGGLARTVLKVAVHASKIGFETHVACLTVSSETVILLDENVQTESFQGITVHNIIAGKERILDNGRDIWDCPHNLSLQMMFQSLEFLDMREDYDIFQSFFLYPVGYITGLLATKRGKPMISCVVGNDVNRYFFSPEKVAVCKSALENSHFVVGLSNDLIQLANSLSPILQKSGVIYNSVEIPEVSWNPSSEAGEPFKIGCAGIFKYAKGLPYLLKAVATLSQSWNVMLELRGQLRDSEKDIFYEMLTRTGLQHLVVLLDPLPHEEIPRWLSGLDIFVLPSITEGCPNILMEALAAGVPTVATRVGAVCELIEDGISGILTPPGDSAALAKAIERLLSDPNLMGNLSGSGRERMRKFNLNLERSKWEKVYRKFADIELFKQNQDK
ncbi:MAG: glycosyltransferase [Desulfomonilaceae bacterium]